ncbi:ubiquitin-conjugating enzyme 25, partial [Prunus dulcis]
STFGLDPLHQPHSLNTHCSPTTNRHVIAVNQIHGNRGRWLLAESRNLQWKLIVAVGGAHKEAEAAAQQQLSNTKTKTSPKTVCRRLLPRSSSPCMDSDDVVEIPPPSHRTPKLQKNKEVILHDVIEIDKDEDSVAAMLIDERVDRSVKGKGIQNSSDAYHDHQAKEPTVNNLFGPSAIEFLGSGNGIEATKSFAPANLINLDGPISDVSYDDDDYTDYYLDEFMDVDEYALLQAHFDNADIPPGIEAPVPWFSDPPNSKVNSVSGSSSVNQSGQIQPDDVGLQGNNSPLSPWSLKTQIDNIPHPPLSPPWKLSKAARSKKKQPALQHQGSAPNLPVGVESSKSQWLLGPFQRKKKPSSSSSSTNYNSVNQFDAMKLVSGSEASSMAYFREVLKKKASSTSYNPPAVPPPIPWWPDPFSKSNTMHLIQVFMIHWVRYILLEKCFNNPTRKLSSMDIDEFIEKFKGFKQFDTIEDHSDHHYTSRGSSTKQPPKNWAKRIQEEWKILEKDLPDKNGSFESCYCWGRGYSYHDGLFFFDVFFPSGYPNAPPNVYYHSGGLRLNPNLYNCGKVCLSLLNTWTGNKNEKWLPGVSTMLQVLVSIQGLILNTKPYFNEPGYARMNGSAAGEKRSLEYNEDTFILSLRTMVYIMRRPPKNFEDFVLGHFYSRARDILVACKAYMDGAQVGCLVKGGVQDVDEGDKSCSQKFKDSLAGYVPMLVTEFTRIGAKDCENFLPPAVVGNNQIASMPQAATSMLINRPEFE